MTFLTEIIPVPLSALPLAPAPTPSPAPVVEEPDPIDGIDPSICVTGDSLCEYVYDLTGNEWLAGAANWLIAKPAAILAILLGAFLVRWIVHKAVDRVASRAAAGMVPDAFTRSKLGRSTEAALLTVGPATDRRAQRTRAMASLLKSIASGVIYAIAAVMVMAELGWNVAPVIASAGILGVALGFGAQSLVKDFLSGMFMIFEDQYGVGDVIDVGEASGTVEAVSLRVTRLRDVNGTVWYVRNGEILRVGNMSQNWARTVLDVSVAYDEDLARVRRVLQEVAHDMWEDELYQPVIIEEPEVWGVEQLAADAVLVRVAIKTAPLEQWAVARELRRRIKDRFDAEGIEIPFAQRVVWHRDAPGPGSPAETPAETPAEPVTQDGRA